MAEHLRSGKVGIAYFCEPVVVSNVVCLTVLSLAKQWSVGSSQRPRQLSHYEFSFPFSFSLLFVRLSLCLFYSSNGSHLEQKDLQKTTVCAKK